MKSHHLYTFALLAGAVALMISGLTSWSEALTPQFIGGALMAVSAVLKGMFQSAPGEITTADIVKLSRKE